MKLEDASKVKVGDLVFPDRRLVIPNGELEKGFFSGKPWPIKVIEVYPNSFVGPCFQLENKAIVPFQLVSKNKGEA